MAYDVDAAFTLFQRMTQVREGNFSAEIPDGISRTAIVR
jgi:hypothetical protein